MSVPMPSALRATWLGRVAYVDAWRLQEAVATRVRAGGAERLLLTEGLVDKAKTRVGWRVLCHRG